MNGIHVHAPAAFMPPEPFVCAPGETIAEIADRQLYRLPHFCILNEEWLPRDEWERPLDEADRLAFVTLPAGGQGGGKDVLRSVLQIAIVVVAVYFAGPAGLGLSGYGLAAARVGAFVLSGYLVNAILPPQQAANPNGALSNLGQASPTYSLNAQGNQARLDTVEPVQYGYHKMVPDFAAQPYTEYRDNDLYLYQLFSLGLGRKSVDEIGIEQTALWTNTDGLTGAFSDVEIEIVNPGGHVTLFPANVITSLEVSGQILLGTNEDGAGWIGPFAACPAGKVVSKIACDLVWQQGAFHVSDTGSLASVNTSLRIEAREIDDYDTPLGDWLLLSGEVYTFAKREQQRVTVRSDVSTGRWQVRVMRTNDALTDDRSYDEVQWAGLRGYVPGANAFSRVTTLAIVMRATNQLSNTTARRFYTKQTMMLPIYDADTQTWSAPTATRSISAAAADIIRNSVYGWGRSDAEIDLDRLASLEATWISRGDTFDGVFDQKSDVWSALNDVLHVGRAYAVRVGSAISFVRDEKRTVSRLMMTPRNIKRGSFSTDFVHFDTDTPDDVIVRYFDERVWNWRTVRATLPGSASEKPATVTFFGCTDRTRAWQYGMYLAAQNKYRRIFPRGTVELEGRFVKRGDLVPVSHPLLEWGASADVVDFDEATRTLTVSTPVTLKEGADSYLALKKPDGSAWGPVLVTAGATAYQLIADVTDLTAAIIAYGDWADFIVTLDGAMEPSVAVWGAAGSFVQDCLLVGARSAGQDYMTLDLVADDDRVYTADGGEPPTESEVTVLPVTPTGPEIYGLHVEVSGTRFAPILTTSIFRSPGADGYILELSYDHLSWRTLQAGDQISWTGEVDATTVWLRWTAIGVVRGTPQEWTQNLTATDAVPAALTGVSVQAFFTNAWINVTYPDEDGIEGVIAKVDVTTGFDPEVAGTVAYDGDPLRRITIDISAAPTVYARVAAYNRFGKVNLNWSSELEITAATVGTGSLSPELLAQIAQIAVNATDITNEATIRSDADSALASSIDTVSAVADGAAAAIVTEATARADGDSANATSITTLQATVDDNTASIETTNTVVAGHGARSAVKLDVNGHVVGTELVNGGVGESSFTILVDKFIIANATDPDAAPFQFVDGVLTLSEAVISKALVDYLAANWADIGTLVTGRIESTDAFMFIDFNDKVFEIA